MDQSNKGIVVDDDNYLELAIKNYINPVIESPDEFENDLNIIRSLKRQFGKYVRKQELNETLILNHLITLHNVFEHYFMVEMVFYKCEEEYYPIIKTFLLFLGYITEIYRPEIEIDPDIVKVLRKI